MRRIFKRFREDRGSAESVAFIVIIPLLVTFVMAFIDIGIYFNEKNILTTAAQAGARDAAIYGGNGKTSGSKKIRKKYGQEGSTSEQVVMSSIPDSYKKSIDTDELFRGISCGSYKDGKITGSGAVAGEPVGCTISKEYNSSISIGPFKMTPSKVKAVGVSVSEVSAK